MMTYEDFKRNAYIEAFSTLRAYDKNNVERYLRRQESDIRYIYDKAKADAEQSKSNVPFKRGIADLCNSWLYDYSAEDDKA